MSERSSAEPEATVLFDEEFLLAGPVDQAWNALTHSNAVAQWLDDHVEIEPRVGGAFRFGGARTPTFANGPHADQLITAIEPRRLLAFRWTWAGAASRCTLTLREGNGTTCRLRVRHELATLIPGMPARHQRHLVQDFWHLAIGNLDSYLRSGRPAIRVDHTSTADDLEISIDVDASPDRVWTVLTDPREMRRWLAPDDPRRLSPKAEMRVGGAYSYGWESQGAAIGPDRILELEAGRRLLHSWTHEGDSTNATEWTITPLDAERCRLAVRQLRTADERERSAYADGWGSFLFDISRAASAPRPRWFDRTFAFDRTPAEMPSLLDRLRSTAAGIDALVRGLPRETLVRRLGETWSIQENVGHLVDLEELHLKRLDELESGAATLSAADVENRRTWSANHNARRFEEVVEDFRASRGRFVSRLAAWPRERLEVSGLHPRLGVPMRVIDLADFCVEHDEHHLARIEELRGTFTRA